MPVRMRSSVKRLDYPVYSFIQKVIIIEWLLIDCKTTKPFTLINNRILIRGLWGNSHIHSVLFFNESGDVIGGIAKRGYDIPSVAKFRIVGLIAKRLWN